MLRTDARSPDVAFGWRIVDAIVVVRRRVAVPFLQVMVPYLLLIPGVAIVGILGVGLIDLFVKSIHSFDPFLHQEGSLSLEQYRRLVTEGNGGYYGGILGRTLLVACLVTIGSVFMGLVVSYFLVRLSSRRWRVLTLNIILVPFLMGEVVRAFGWLLLLGRHGALDWLTSLAGGPGITLVGTRLGIWIGMMQVMTPLAVLVMLPTVRRIDPDLERAARTLGARPDQVWRLIIIPLARSGLAAAAIVVYSLSMTEFAIPQVLGLGHQPFVANTIYSMYFLQNNLYFGSAFAMVLVLLVTMGVIGIGRLGRGLGGRS